MIGKMMGCSDDTIFSGSTIVPLSLADLSAMMNTSTSGYLFIGGNSSFCKDDIWGENYFFCESTSTAPRFAINLDNLPATFPERGVGAIIGAGRLSVAPLASVLLCDAQPKISGGRVRLENDGTVNVISLGQPPDGSFPSTAANLIFSNALRDAISELEVNEVLNFVNDVAAGMFMTNSSTDWSNAQDIAPFDIPSINKNVDAFMSSAAKAFIDGYRKIGTSTEPTFDSVSVFGLGEEQRLALTTSKELFIITVVLDVIITALLYTLVRSAPTWKGYPLNLANVFRLLEEGYHKER